MAREARISALLLTLLIGLAPSYSLASASIYALFTPVQYAPNSEGSQSEARVVVSSQDDEGEKKEKNADKDTDAHGPLDVFSDIEKGWVDNDVDDILAHFGKSKVTIAIEGAGPTGGTFSKSQSYYLLKDLFKYTITRKFEFVQYRKPASSESEDSPEDDRSTFAVAEHHYQKTDDGRLFKDKIYVSLHLEGDRWVVGEIKSIR